MALPAPFDNPLALGALTVAILALVQYIRTLSYREVVGAQWLATKLFPVLDPLAKKRLSRPLTREKWMPEKDPDYLATLTFSARAVAKKLRSDGFDPQLLSTAKYRVRDGRREWIHSQWAYYHDDGTQTHVYLFVTDDGTDVYAHHEAAVTDPAAHHKGDQTHGDPRGVVADALALRPGANQRERTKKV